MKQFLIYFLIGAVLDWAVTVQTVCVVEGRRFAAAFWTLLLTLASLGVLDRFIESRDWLLVAGYAAGNAFGTWIGMIRRGGEHGKSKSSN